MRHRKQGSNLGRKSDHRHAMLANLTISLVRHELIKTTLPRAKELRRIAEPLITRAKQDTTANRRVVFARLRNKETIDKLFETLGPRYADRPGGYLRILKCGYRAGDRAPMAYVELIDRPQSDQDDEEDAA